MHEFVYYSEQNLEFPLPQTIHVTNDISNITNDDYIISNSKSINAQVIANEIDFYIQNSQDPISEKIKNVEKLYEMNAIRFDLAQDISYSEELNNRVLLVASIEEKREFLKHTVPDEFDLFHVDADSIKNISGYIGNLSIVIDDNGKDVILNVSQIVWFDQTEMAMKQSGAFDPLESSIDSVVAQLRSNIANYEYKKFTVYDKDICQYHERREEICSKCEEVCPTVAIIKDDANKHLHFSQIDCLGCGGCISVCPSGALDYAPMNRESISQMSKQLKGHIPLVVPEKMNIKELNVSIKENVLPFAIEGEKFLHEGTFLTLLQESGAQVIFYSDFLSKGSKEAISILNQVYQLKYNKEAILVAMNEEELQEAIEKVSFVENSYFPLNEGESRKREIFAIRLEHIVGQEDLGVVHTGPHVHYAHVKVNEDKCTLCLSCVGACNVAALIADTSDNTLRLNPSLCTACGYCEPSCPEPDCLSIEQDVIKLNPAWFKEEILAQDELFACVECGKEFATKKSIEKIAAMMGPLFASNPIKERTLYCCEDCKPKLMIKQGLLDA